MDVRIRYSIFYAIFTLLALTFILLIPSCITFDPQNVGAKKTKGPVEGKSEESSEFVKVKGEVLWEKALISNEIRCVAADDKYVWIATDRGVSKLTRKNNAWTHYTKAEGLASDDVNAVAVDVNLVWFATNDGVSRYDTSSGKWKTFRKEDGLASNKVQSIAVDGNYVWFGTISGINRYDKQIDSWALRSKKDGLSTNNVTSIAVEGEYVWVGTQPEKERSNMDYWGGPRDKGKPGSGVNRYHRRTDSWNTYSKTDGLADDKLVTIAVGEDDVWFGTLKDGVSVYSKTDQTFVKTYSRTDVLTSNKIESIAVDGSQIWIGTANAGAQRYLKTVNTWVNYTMADGLASNHVTWISVHGNEVWFATYESGLSKYDKASNKWVTYVKQDSLADDDLKVVKADQKGNIWVGTALGLSVYEPQKKEWSNYRRKDGLITDYITDVEIKNGAIWVGTNRGVGAMDEKTGKWNFYACKDGLNGDFITSLIYIEDNIWAGTQKGLCKLDSASQKWSDEGKSFGLSEKLVNELTYDGKDLLWIGTEDGLWKYNLSNMEAIRYSTDDGLANNYINSISISDDRNVIYVGTQGGLSIYKDGKWAKIDLQIPNQNIMSMILEGKNLWIGTMSGLVKYEIDSGTYSLVNIGENYSQRNIKSICISGDSIWLGTTAGLLKVNKSDGTLVEEYRTSLIKEPFREPTISNIEFDGDFVWFSNWSSSPNGSIVRFDKRTRTWRRFTREDILHNTKLRAPSEIKRILVTQDYVWFSTDHGVLRYDKNLDTWKRYTMDDGLASNDMRIMVESTKSVWMCASEDIAITRYHKDTGQMETIDLPQVPGYPPAMEWLEYMEADGPDLWLAFWSRFCGVRRYNEETDTWYFYTRKEGLTKTGAQWISIDKDRVWVSHGYRGGLSYYEKTTGKWFTLASNILQGEARRIIVGEKSVWVIVDARGPGSVARYDKENDEWTTIRPKGGFMGDATDLVSDGDYVWMSTFNDGVNRFHMASGTWMNFNDRNGLPQNHVNDRALKVDDKYVWVGTPRGLSIFNKETETWTSYMNPETLIGNEVRSVVADERYVWCGTSQGLSRYDKRYGTWTNFRQKGGRQFISDGHNSWSWWEPEDEDSLVNNDINSLAVDERYLWVGTKEGASRYDKIADSWDRYNRETGLPNNDVVSVVVDGYDVWAGTGAGLCKYPRMSDDPNAWITYTSGIEIKPMVVSAEDAKSLVSDEIWSLAADGKYVWVGTRIGVSRYDKGRDVWTTFDRTDGMASNAVSSIAVENGRIWFGSDSGVTMFDKNTNDWTIMSNSDGLSSDRITCIASDGDYIWFGTFDAGVSRYNKKTKKWDNFNKNDGLAHNSVLSIAVDGDLVWFGTNRGMSRYDKITETWTIFTQFFGPEDL